MAGEFAEIVSSDGHQYIKLTPDGEIKMKAYQIWRIFFGVIVFAAVIAILGIVSW